MSHVNVDNLEIIETNVKRIYIIKKAGYKLNLPFRAALASLYIDNTKPICYNIAKKNSHVVLISVSEHMANCKNRNKSFNGALGTLGGLF